MAAAIWALWPNLVFHSAIVLTETLFLFLFVLLLVVTLGDPAAARAPGRARLVGIGVLFGLCVLVRPVSLVAAPAFLVLWWGPAVRQVAWRCALAALAALAVLVPWAVRSTLVMDAPVALSLNLGDNLCLGHNPGASGGFGDLAAHCYTGEGLRRPEAETRRQSENIDRALRYIRDEPVTTVRRTVTKARITLENDADGLDVAEDFGAPAHRVREHPLGAGGGRQRVLRRGGGGRGGGRGGVAAPLGPGPPGPVPRRGRRWCSSSHRSPRSATRGSRCRSTPRWRCAPRWPWWPPPTASAPAPRPAPPPTTRRPTTGRPTLRRSPPPDWGPARGVRVSSSNGGQE